MADAMEIRVYGGLGGFACPHQVRDKEQFGDVELCDICAPAVRSGARIIRLDHNGVRIQEPEIMDARYAGDKPRVAEIGDLVMSPGNIRGIVIDVKGTFVKVLAIGTSKETGVTFVLKPTFIHDFPASECSYMAKQTLNW